MHIYRSSYCQRDYSRSCASSGGRLIPTYGGRNLGMEPKAALEDVLGLADAGRSGTNSFVLRGVPRLHARVFHPGKLALISLLVPLCGLRAVVDVLNPTTRRTQSSGQMDRASWRIGLQASSSPSVFLRHMTYSLYRFLGKRRPIVATPRSRRRCTYQQWLAWLVVGKRLRVNQGQTIASQLRVHALVNRSRLDVGRHGLRRVHTTAS